MAWGVLTENVVDIADDDDDLDEENIPGFSHPSVATSPQSPYPDKGKGRATEQLATPTGGSSMPLSGNIGSMPNGPPKSARRMVGGVQVETR
ncbi:hypothetical protein PHLCEN_2v1266 [Hermanssonia centrifuga]|uniref:Uncharacterized protein n=1 Tax=Hermanssonia centrifuga TaxID=98765 RepID=A0A2R6S3P2_9APHY|nr:hypothetical protein PHLCEN_2v1266 [Hermanssonia centrifuga]